MAGHAGGAFPSGAMSYPIDRGRPKYSENRDFAPGSTGLLTNAQSRINRLGMKFVIWRNNGIFSPINEFSRT